MRLWSMIIENEWIVLRSYILLQGTLSCHKNEIANIPSLAPYVSKS